MVCIIRNAIKQYRVKIGLTQEDLAERVDVTRQTIGLIEKEKYNPTILLALKLSDVLEVSLDKLFWMEEESDEKR